MNLIVTAEDGGTWLDWGAGKRRCAVGKGGIAVKGGEGDGITPRGLYPIREIFYRADRIAKPDTALPVRAIRKDDGWCDAPDDPNYNQLVKLPYPASAEHMWREDDVYDLVCVLAHNDDPPVPGLGSAIFMHLARPGYAPTEGCVALSREDMLDLLAVAKLGDAVAIVEG